jgi:ABC-type transporter Mla subunit MlaD
MSKEWLMVTCILAITALVVVIPVADRFIRKALLRKGQRLLEELQAQRKEIRRQIEGIEMQLEVFQCTSQHSDRLIRLHGLLAQVDDAERDLRKAAEKFRRTA